MLAPGQTVIHAASASPLWRPPGRKVGRAVWGIWVCGLGRGGTSQGDRGVGEGRPGEKGVSHRVGLGEGSVRGRGNVSPGGYDGPPGFRGACTAGDLQVLPHQVSPGGLLPLSCCSVHQPLSCCPMVGQDQVQLVVPCKQPPRQASRPRPYHHDWHD